MAYKNVFFLLGLQKKVSIKLVSAAFHWRVLLCTLAVSEGFTSHYPNSYG